MDSPAPTLLFCVCSFRCFLVGRELCTTTNTFKIQFLLKLFVQLLSVELGVCALKIKVAFKLDRVLFDVSWAVLPSGAIPRSSVPCEKEKPELVSRQADITPRETNDKEGQGLLKRTLSPGTPETVVQKARQSTAGWFVAPQNSSGNSCYLISSSEVFCSHRSPALDFAQLPAELHLRRNREE